MKIGYDTETLGTRKGFIDKPISTTICFIKCDNCGKITQDSLSNYKRKKSEEDYCISCRNLLSICGIKGKSLSQETINKMKDGSRSKENNSNWKGGISDENKLIRNSKQYELWRKAVFERDNYTCKSCGRIGGNLNAHHIKSFSEYQELRLIVNNGMTLCEKCHRLKHKKFNKTIIIDIDNTICSQEEDYNDAKPYLKRIYKVNQMHDMDNEIVFFTARGTETGIDWREVTEKQLKTWGVKYHKLIFGKPAGDIFIDDRAEKDDFLGEKK